MTFLPFIYSSPRKDEFIANGSVSQFNGNHVAQLQSELHGYADRKAQLTIKAGVQDCRDAGNCPTPSDLNFDP